MKKLLLILPFALFTTLIFAFESDRWGRSAVTSANVTDSCKQVRSEITDSIVVFDDTMEANPVLINDLKIIDSLQVPVWEAGPATGAVGMFGADTANDSLFFYLPGGKTALYPQASAGAMSGGDIFDSINDASRSVDQTWTFTATSEWDGGNIIAADGQKFIVTDDTEEDSSSWYDNGDTTFFTSDNILILGDAGTTEIGDSLGLCLWNDKGATATVGVMGLDTNGTDTAWIYTQDGWKSFVPAAAGGAGADDWVWSVAIPDWDGGNETKTNNDNVLYYVSSGVNDEFWSTVFTLPFQNEGSAIVLDSVILDYYTAGVEDSIHVYLQKINNRVPTEVDSVWLGGGATGDAEGNLLPNGDKTIAVADGGYRLSINCVNNGATDIRVGYYLRIVCHK